jgi:hypothetical protein
VADHRADGSRPRVHRTEAALVVLSGLLAAVVYTYPLVHHFTVAIPYACGVTPERRVQSLVPGDPLQFFYFLCVTDDMVHGRAPWFQDPYEFSAPDPPTRRSFFFLPFSSRTTSWRLAGSNAAPPPVPGRESAPRASR